MKKLFYFGCLWMLATACNKDTATTSAQIKSNLEGKWQFTAIYIQTSGPGSWYAEDSVPADYIQFNEDKSLTMSHYVSFLFNDPISYTVLSDSAFAFQYPNNANTVDGGNIMHYKLEDSILTITPPDIEFAQEKFVRVVANP